MRLVLPHAGMLKQFVGRPLAVRSHFDIIESSGIKIVTFVGKRAPGEEDVVADYPEVLPDAGSGRGEFFLDRYGDLEEVRDRAGAG